MAKFTETLNQPDLTQDQVSFIEETAKATRWTKSEVVRASLDYLRGNPGSDSDYVEADRFPVRLFPIQVDVESFSFANSYGDTTADCIRRALWAYKKYRESITVPVL